MPEITGPLKDKVTCTFAFKCPTRSKKPVARQRIGVGESATLEATGAPAGAIWSVRSGPGVVVVSADGHTATFTATDTASETEWATVVLKADNVDAVAVVVFEVVRPNKGRLDLVSAASSYYQPNYQNQGKPSAGFAAWMYLLPNDVSFMNVEFQEGGGVCVAEGAFRTYNGVVHTRGTLQPPAQGYTWAQPWKVTDLGTQFHAEDHVQCVAESWNPNDPQLSTGRMKWPIEWIYRVKGQQGDGKVFDTVSHNAAVAADGTLTLEKGSVFVEKPLPRMPDGSVNAGGFVAEPARQPVTADRIC